MKGGIFSACEVILVFIALLLIWAPNEITEENNEQTSITLPHKFDDNFRDKVKSAL